MQPLDRLVWHLVKQVVETVLPDETGPKRLQQVAVLLTVHALQDHDEPVTSARISEIYGMTHSSTHRIIAVLLERGLIEKTTIRNRLNRGHSTALRVVETEEIAAIRAALRNET